MVKGAFERVIDMC